MQKEHYTKGVPKALRILDKDQGIQGLLGFVSLEHAVFAKLGPMDGRST